MNTNKIAYRCFGISVILMFLTFVFKFEDKTPQNLLIGLILMSVFFMGVAFALKE